MTVYVLGGGPTGLALVDGLKGQPFVLIEKEQELGGLAATLPWGQHGWHDLGPHKIFTRDSTLLRRVEALLPTDAWLTRPKHSSIFMCKQFVPYPPSPLSLLSLYGGRTFAAMVRDYAAARLRTLATEGRPENFAADLEDRVGGRLYRELFAPIAAKLWGDPRELDVKLSRGRVQTPRFTELITRALHLRTTSDFEALSFRYPRGGMRTLWAAIAERAQGRGRFVTGQAVEQLAVEDRRVRAIICRDAAGSQQTFELKDEDYVFSTLPLGNLVRLLGDEVGASIHEHVRSAIRLNDLTLCMLKVDRQSLLQDSWVFVPDPAIAFHRVSEQESFDPGMTPRGSIVCCEFMGTDARPVRGWSDEQLARTAEQGLRQMGFADFVVEDSRVLRLPASYPVYQVGYEPALTAVLDELDGFANLRTIGRQGAFNYIGTLDSMDIGFGAARWLLEHQDRPAWSWRAERRRTAHYPVLD